LWVRQQRAAEDATGLQVICFGLGLA
jgi:hypothetical protein